MNIVALLASLNSPGIALVARKELQIDNASYFILFSISLGIEKCVYSVHELFISWHSDFLSTCFTAYRNRRSLLSAQKNNFMQQEWNITPKNQHTNKSILSNIKLYVRKFCSPCLYGWFPSISLLCFNYMHF